MLRPGPVSGSAGSGMGPGYGLDLEPALGPSVRDMTMKYRTLGGTGIQVSAYCLGTMMFGADGNPDHGDCARIIHAALDHGINFVDTADIYSDGESEQIVGNALKGRRDDIVVATKVHFPHGRGPQPRRQLAALDPAGGGRQPAAAADRLARPLPDPPPRPVDRHRGDPLRAH
ncbi:aldo/keto reductase [Pseudonocardia sp.]|uniref:aldo/keto reductase n=1 Tax=Pseudonocardia sp. TaxID=60912 RepID=UPI0039C8E604